MPIKHATTNLRETKVIRTLIKVESFNRPSCKKLLVSVVCVCVFFKDRDRTLSALTNIHTRFSRLIHEYLSPRILTAVLFSGMVQIMLQTYLDSSFANKSFVLFCSRHIF